jgi:hypothetical protein
VNVRAEPFISAPKVGEMPRDAGVTVLGRAVLGGITSEYIYVREDATGLEGWVIDNTIVTMGRNNEDEISALPVLYEVKVDGDLFQLPHVIVVNTHLRAGPGLDASIRRTVPYADYAVLGRNATGEWFHVMDRRSGEQGWIAVSVIAPGLLDIESLPVVE